MASAPPLLQLLESQQHEYRTALQQSLAAMEAAWRRARDAEPRSQALAELERIAHTVAGSALTFGFVAAGEAAHNLELALHYLVTRRRPWSAGVELTVDLLLDRLRVAIGKAAPGGS